MKSFVMLLGILSVSASTPGKLGTESVLAILQTSASPSSFATSLMQSSTAQQSAQCSSISGHEHCLKCAKPLMAMLVDQLVQVKAQVWKQHNTRKTGAKKVCTDLAPAQRPGGNGKCCSGSGHRSYDVHGYTLCAGNTFSPSPPIDAKWTDLKYNADAFSYRYQGPQRSSMVKDCCEPSSVCTKSAHTYTTTLETKIEKLNSKYLALQSLRERIQANSGTIGTETGSVHLRTTSIARICEMTKANTDSVPPNYPTTELEMQTRCIGGVVKNTNVATTKSVTKVAADISSMAETIKIVSKVMRWLDTGIKDGKEQAFKTSSHDTSYQGNAPTPAAMVLLIEQAKAGNNNAVAQNALARTIQLVQSSKTSRVTVLHSIFLKLIQRLEESRKKMAIFKASVLSNHKASMASYLKAIQAHVNMRDISSRNIGVSFSLQASTKADIALAMEYIQAKKKEWATTWVMREAHTQKCRAYMKYYDSETLVSTDEILVLKKAIDIIRHISCVATQQPTMSPTAFPTRPIRVTPAPTAFPTLAPTQYPTSRPTKSPTVAKKCPAGKYLFMSKVFSEPERFNPAYAVPSFSNGVKYNIKKEMEPNACIKIRTSHANIDGSVQHLDHWYKCCPATGSPFGSITAFGSSKLCSEATHCHLFGGNMYLVGTADPSKRPMFGGTSPPTGFPTAFPTTHPTAFPTLASSISAFPTAYPTTTPTESPTAFPTAESHSKAWWDIRKVVTNGKGFTPEPVVCSASEGAECSCTGTAYFGKRYLHGKPGSGAEASPNQMLASKYITKSASGSITCSQSAFGGSNPLPGYFKKCWCLPTPAVISVSGAV